MCMSWLLLILIVSMHSSTTKIKFSLPFTQYRSGDKMENNEMGGTCSTYAGDETCKQGFGGDT